jgi:hypothetical protein
MPDIANSALVSSFQEHDPFNREKHVYKNDAFVELIKDGIRFFNGTPVQTLPPPVRFLGSGIYALYFTGKAEPYSIYAELNRLAYDFPIYAGKAVPKGWRQSRSVDTNEKQAAELYTRLCEHTRNISAVTNLSLNDFTCRFMILEGASSDMIGSLEASLIKWKKPLWNSYLDGFGNHTPGSGRFAQARSDWDVVHPGRPWAEKCTGKYRDRESIILGIKNFLAAEVCNIDSAPMDPGGGSAFE